MTYYKQSGFSILSLMISIAMGSFIMAAAINAYAYSKQAFNTQAALAAASENGRFALSDMRRTLLMAGRDISVDSVDGNSKGLFEQPVGDFNSSISDGDSDSVAVWYATGKDCHGASINNPTLSEFSVSNGNLQCTVDNDTRTLVSGIEKMQVLYGIDTTAAGDNYADRYYTATQLNALYTGADPDIWKRLVSIRIGLVASSEGGPTIGDNSMTLPTFTVLDQSYTPTNTKKLYRAFSGTISLRNMNAVNR